MIYVGPGADDATDSEHPPVFLPPTGAPDHRCSIRRALRGSCVDSTKIQDSPRTPRKTITKKSPKHLVKEIGSPSKIKDRSKEGTEKNDTKVECSREDTTGNSLEQLASNKSPCKQCSQSMKLGSNLSPKIIKCSHVIKPRKVLPIDNTLQGTSDEQWVDGPRFHRSKVLESQKIKEYELETWIDGPEATYGYMDDVKKSMIQKWVETQNSPVLHKEINNLKSPKHTQYKEMTQFKTSENEELSPKHKDKQREKRKSSDGRELRKDSSKYSSKDSPHRRRSFNGPHQRCSTAEHDRKQSVETVEANSSPSQCKHIDEVPQETTTINNFDSPRKELTVSYSSDDVKSALPEVNQTLTDTSTKVETTKQTDSMESSEVPSNPLVAEKSKTKDNEIFDTESPVKLLDSKTVVHRQQIGKNCLFSIYCNKYVIKFLIYLSIYCFIRNSRKH